MRRYKEWSKKDYPKADNLNVFGTFVCGGGSTMGYKLAGFNHLGGVEIDKRMADLYSKNHNPKYMYVEDIRDFNKRKDLPKELCNLDILDGSPPCTTFSMAGQRETNWGKKKQFNEGQTSQVLDELVYVYCETINKLQPKVAILENVPGIIAGRAKKYAINIVEMLNNFGYDIQVLQLNSATMGVPQARERVFFIARRKDLNFQPIEFNFNNDVYPFGSIVDKGSKTCEAKPLIPSIRKRWKYVEKGDENLKYADAKYRNLNTHNAFFGTQIMYDDVVPGTLTCSGNSVYYDEVRNLNDTEYRRMSTFPIDYDFQDKNVRYVCGMSVPPLMMKAIATTIKKEWFELAKK